MPVKKSKYKGKGVRMVSVTLTITHEMKEYMANHQEINWSGMFREILKVMMETDLTPRQFLQRVRRGI